MRDGQSLVVWAIREGRGVAKAVHHYLTQKHGTTYKIILTFNERYNKMFIVFIGGIPSPAEGIGLENRQGLNGPRGFESLFLRHYI